MINKWQKLPLIECLDALIDYRGKTPTKTTSGIPLVTAKIIKNGRIEKPTEFISISDYEPWMRRGIPKEGDVVMTTEAPLGEVAQIGKDKIALAQRVITLRSKAEILDSTYLLYLLQTKEMQEQLKSRSTGTTVLGIKQSELKKITISLPPMKLQKDSWMLAILDKRIDLLRETNATLESIAQILFKSWFIDFDPVHAKAECREPEGMDAETAALFPDSFVESELGAIPKGWYVTNLGDAYEINPTRKLKKGELGPYLDMSNVPIRGHHAAKTILREMGSGTKFINGDTLLARITPCLENGKTAFVDFLDDNQIGWGSTEFVVLRPKEPIPPYHGYLLARHSAFREFAIQSMSGTSGRQRIQNNVLSRYLITIPAEAILDVFGSIVSSIQQKITANSRQAIVLEQKRDVLLPRLISGDLQLPIMNTNMNNEAIKL